MGGLRAHGAKPPYFTTKDSTFGSRPNRA